MKFLLLVPKSSKKINRLRILLRISILVPMTTTPCCCSPNRALKDPWPDEQGGFIRTTSVRNVASRRTTCESENWNAKSIRIKKTDCRSQKNKSRNSTFLINLLNLASPHNLAVWHQISEKLAFPPSDRRQKKRQKSHQNKYSQWEPLGPKISKRYIN